MNWKEEDQEKMTDEQRKMLTVDILREILDYDPDSGKFIWKVKMSTKAMPGYIAGCKRKNNGYRVLRIFGVNYHEHRLAWMHFYGHMPDCDIDHINAIRNDNRISNLRLATSTENKRNSIHKNNTGLIGASYSSINGKYRAQIRVEGARIFLGWFNSAEEASAAYIAASEKHHGEFSACKRIRRQPWK